ncbi:outer membrane lipoprotein-sorting protein [Telluribacter sp. SYSU D00476]|uniref:outer membrane lipoprotein-sorting protein n=1 Tax=Telluribacter sp. SYSU D00476 TaxID=2811430 RepID=UPI001FF4AC2B|nr:outer membrane lipoprotein-sorting protein [Telluribacter sp. SYSU D00476]
MQAKKLMVTAVAALFSLSTFAQTVDELVDKHVAALGGADKLAGVKTLVTERSLSINGMDIPMKVSVVVGKSMRSESSVMGNAMVQVVDGSTGWMIRPSMMGGTGDPEDMPAEVVKQQAGELDPFPLFGYKEKGSQIELLGKEKVDRKDTYHLKVTTPAGQVVEQYLDATTYLISKVKVTTMDGQPGELFYSDYKDIEGIKFPKIIEIAGGQMGTLTFVNDKIKVNVPVDEKLFKKSSR